MRVAAVVGEPVPRAFEGRVDPARALIVHAEGAQQKAGGLAQAPVTAQGFRGRGVGIGVWTNSWAIKLVLDSLELGDGGGLRVEVDQRDLVVAPKGSCVGGVIAVAGVGGGGEGGRLRTRQMGRGGRVMFARVVARQLGLGMLIGELGSCRRREGSVPGVRWLLSDEI